MRRPIVGALATAFVAALLVLAIVVRPDRHARTAMADSNRPSPDVTPPSAPSIGVATRPPVVLELGVTREGGEHQTLLRIRSEPQGDFRIEEATDASAAPAAAK
jgi:hypothetical protein